MYSASIKLFLILSLFFQIACDEVATVSILEETDNFEQNTSSFDNKIDILWVVDNSGSMQNLQDNVAANFESFINQFANKNYDFQMAVTTTDAWLESKGNNYQNCGQSTGISAYRNNSGYSILKPSTPNLSDAFIQNISAGIYGCGDERAFSSMIEALGNPDNVALGFPRSDAFLAVIIVSDEDDFSHDDGEPLFNDHQDNRIHSVSLYDEALQIITASNADRRTYNVSSIAIFDQACVVANDPWGILASRYESLVDATNGVKASVCASDFSKNLEDIQQKIAVLSTQFFLSRKPIVESIVVMVDGEEIPNDSNNGWSYDGAANSILFHGAAIPNQGASIDITFDPVTLKN